MAKTKSEFKGKDTNELMKLLKQKRDMLHSFTFNVLNGKEKNVKTGRTVRKDIARILTEMNAQKKTPKTA